MAAQDLENGLEWINLVCVWPKLRWHCWEQRVLLMWRWWGSLWVQPQFLSALCPVPWVWDGSWQADWSCVTALCLVAVSAAGILCQMGSSQVDGFWLVSWEHMKEIQLWMHGANGMAVPASMWKSCGRLNLGWNCFSRLKHRVTSASRAERWSRADSDSKANIMYLEISLFYLWPQRCKLCSSEDGNSALGQVGVAHQPWSRILTSCFMICALRKKERKH